MSPSFLQGFPAGLWSNSYLWRLENYPPKWTTIPVNHKGLAATAQTNSLTNLTNGHSGHWTFAPRRLAKHTSKSGETADSWSGFQENLQKIICFPSHKYRGNPAKCPFKQLWKGVPLSGQPRPSKPSVFVSITMQTNIISISTIYMYICIYVYMYICIYVVAGVSHLAHSSWSIYYDNHDIYIYIWLYIYIYIVILE